MAKTQSQKLPDLDLNLLNVSPDDEAARKLLMLVEGTFGIGVKKSIEKYDYSEPRYYQLLKAFKESGTEALINKKRGPKFNSKRDDKVIQHIIRYRFLYPDISAAVISQKLKQKGHPVSIRSVERTISEYGLQKKTLPVKPQ